ncbi:MAG: hypothetical protein QOE55_4708, partial [Acidobacteriaceae bacterium]|nr:hypothetical protein [Acidobacteriaceae bacterium]
SEKGESQGSEGGADLERGKGLHRLRLLDERNHLYRRIFFRSHGEGVA